MLLYDMLTMNPSTRHGQLELLGKRHPRSRILELLVGAGSVIVSRARLCQLCALSSIVTEDYQRPQIGSLADRSHAVLLLRLSLDPRTVRYSYFAQDMRLLTRYSLQI